MISDDLFTPTLWLPRPDGDIAYSRTGSGDPVLLSPGMGDLRRTFRHLIPGLVDAGYETITADLRGHGDSDASFAEYRDEATAEDLIALLEEIGAPAVVVGSSMSAAAAVIVAARRPELVRGLVLLGPFLRDPSTSPLMSTAMRILMHPRWIGAVWHRYLPTLYAGRRPEDFEEHRTAVRESLRRPDHAVAFSRTTRTSHREAEALVPRVTAPSTVIMGALDPDFPDPEAEAQWAADALGGSCVMVPDAGHYPHAQQPEDTLVAVVGFLGGLADA
ncbi:MAG: alpha/beta hydrolase [Nesterenkonia sp.]|uniref:alpha/beta fold hydrolase n=1 Tax=Nesterenkonia marinintestina TaxID=2979865 RepID=UPI0021BF93C5|nr:alpha/beta hydrolase [Nesterenkonia sp. GX14115]MDO5493091.1 alpha/beta hydrolase [Nesterenkonia sp.]